nr:HmuY family protein [uncultured Capnocytophaga sp.]
MKRYIYSILIALLGIGCVKYEATPFTGKVLPRRSGYINEVTNDWIYYNLRTGEIFNAQQVNSDIREGEQKTRMDWDLAFCGNKLRTNSGTSGNGRGGVADMGFQGYDRWTSVSQVPRDIVWVVDTNNISITMSQREWVSYTVAHNITGIPWFDPNKGPQQTKTSASPLLNKALVFSGPPPSYQPSFHTYLVRTADGARYFKLQVVSWYDESIEIGETGGRISFYCDELK